VLPGSLVLALVAQGTLAADTGVRIAQEGSLLLIAAGERPILEYQCAPSPMKPYARRMFSPSGVQVLRDSPSDHKHHHALMFALGADSVDFWAETQASGLQRQKSLSVGKSAAGFVQELEWIDVRSGQPLLVERRTVLAHGGTDRLATLVTWNSRLAVPAGRESTILTGSHYFGLGMRFVESMDKGGGFSNSDAKEGETVRGSEKLTPARWCVYTAVADGRKVTIGIFDHPANPRHPAKMFTMTTPFAYLAATMNLWKEPMRLNAGQDLNLMYGVAVWDGEADRSRIEQLYQRWQRQPTER